LLTNSWTINIFPTISSAARAPHRPLRLEPEPFGTEARHNEERRISESYRNRPYNTYRVQREWQDTDQHWNSSGSLFEGYDQRGRYQGTPRQPRDYRNSYSRRAGNNYDGGTQYSPWAARPSRDQGADATEGPVFKRARNEEVVRSDRPVSEPAIEPPAIDVAAREISNSIVNFLTTAAPSAANTQANASQAPQSNRSSVEGPTTSPGGQLIGDNSGKSSASVHKELDNTRKENVILRGIITAQANPGLVSPQDNGNVLASAMQNQTRTVPTGAASITNPDPTPDKDKSFKPPTDEGQTDA